MWNYPHKFSNVPVHLGDFHFMKKIFNVVDTMIDGSGFNDIIFQANLCSSESLASVINGSHYNRCWRVQKPFAEALERLLMEKFIDYKQLAIPETVIAFTESYQFKQGGHKPRKQGKPGKLGDFENFSKSQGKLREI